MIKFNDSRIDSHKHYFVLINGDWIECILTEDNYKISTGYKVELVSLRGEFNKSIVMKQTDFIKYINSNIIVVKGKNTKLHKVRLVDFIGNVKVYTEGYVVA